MDSEHGQLGHRIREIRHWRGMSLTATAGLAGVSPAYLSMIERGQRPVNRRSVLESLARALRVSPLELTGQPHPSPGDARTASAVATLSDVLGGWWIGEAPPPGRPAAQALADLAAFHAARTSSRPHAAGDYATQAQTLAALIRDLLAASADPSTAREALPALLTAYHVAGSTAARLRVTGLPALAADRMRQAADRLDDPTWRAVADWARAHFLSGTNRERQYDLAVAVADGAARPETRGMANLTAAVAASARGDAALATAHLDEAAAVAERVEPDVSPWPSGIMQFGRTNVGIFRVAVGVELGEGARVREFAATFRPEPASRGRQAAYWIDYGRGLLAERRTREEGLLALLRAEKLAPHQVRASVFAREAVASLLVTTRQQAGGRDLRGLAWRLGVASV